MKFSKRAIRRHHYSRLKKKRKNYWGWAESDRKTGILANTPATCSCFMCGNPRRQIGEISLQEKRQFAKEQEYYGK